MSHLHFYILEFYFYFSSYFYPHTFLITKLLLNAERETTTWYSHCIFVNIFIDKITILSIIGALFSVCRKEGHRNQRFILTQMHRRRRQHNGTRNALCCHCRRPNNLHDFSVSAQQSASRIIHSSFDLDGRHSTASHSSGCTSTSVDPKLFLHLHQSRVPYSSFEGEECSRDIISFSFAESANHQVYRQYPFARGARATRSSSFARARSSERIATLINQSRHARDKSSRVIY